MDINFDVYQLNNEKTTYDNLKMICGSGGDQTRALREVYHFISAQQRYLNEEQSSKLFFVNILDEMNVIRKLSYSLQQNMGKYSLVRSLSVMKI